VSEWGNFLLIFSRPIREGKQIQNYDHDAYFNKGPPSFSGPDRQLLLPPLGGVWPRPGSGILVYLPPEQGPPLPPPPPPTPLSDSIPLPSFASHPVTLSYSDLFVVLSPSLPLIHIRFYCHIPFHFRLIYLGQIVSTSYMYAHLNLHFPFFLSTHHYQPKLYPPPPPINIHTSVRSNWRCHTYTHLSYMCAQLYSLA